MADVAISGLTALGGAPATNDLLVEVDVSDTTQAPTGTTKKMTVVNLFTAPTITTPHFTSPVVDSGGLTVTLGGLTVTAGGLTVSAGTTAVQALTAASLILGATGVFGASTVNFSGFTGQAKFFGGTTGLTIRDTTDSFDNFAVTNAGAVTIRSTLVVSGATATMPLLVGIGGLTAAFPALKRSGATLEVRAADDSGYTNLNVSALSTATGDVFSQTNVTASTGVFKVGANQVVGARSTGWATQTVTTGAKTDIGASGTWTTTSVGNLLMAHHAALLAHGLIGA